VLAADGFPATACVTKDYQPTEDGFATPAYDLPPACAGQSSCDCLNAEQAKEAAIYSSSTVDIECDERPDGGLVVEVTNHTTCGCYGCPPARLERRRAG
jgi:hypothetical protein